MRFGDFSANTKPYLSIDLCFQQFENGIGKSSRAICAPIRYPPSRQGQAQGGWLWGPAKIRGYPRPHLRDEAPVCPP